MTLAPFFSRVRDAVGGTAAITADELDAALEDTVVSVSFGDRAAEHQPLSDGGVLLVDLLARLYPRITIEGPAELRRRATLHAEAINPGIEIVDTTTKDERVVRVVYGGSDDSRLCLDADGWQVQLDQPPIEPHRQVMAPAADGAACIAAAEVFRDVFAGALGSRARIGRQPGALDLVTGTPIPAPVVDLEGIDLGEIHLAGAGAIGQSCIHTLRNSGPVGHLVVVDPETIELSNLQRYVLTTPKDVGSRKVDVVTRNLDNAGWSSDAVFAHWGADPRCGPRRRCVLAALDTARDRIGVAAGIHDAVYNAWTQPADVGWSRHEDFGVTPCLACLYYPDRVLPSDDELIAEALGQPRLRVLGYLVTRTPVGVPLPAIVEAADIAAPPDSEDWLRRPLLADLVSSGLLPASEAPAWTSHRIGDLYSEGICGGGILGVATNDTERIVPLAHQSAFAGVMLAVQVIVANHDQLRPDRSPHIEQRIDLLAGLPQVLGRPRKRTPGCICSDDRYQAKPRSTITSPPLQMQTS